MISLGLVGWPVSQSLSPQLHNAALKSSGLEGVYSLYPVDPQEPGKLLNLVDRVRSGEIRGLNVTIPHKQSIIPFVDELTITASSIGAVNTIYMKNGLLYGDNTDAQGFQADLVQNSGITNYSDKIAIVLGAGGSARAVVWALHGLSCRITIAARNVEQGRFMAERYNNQSKNNQVKSIGLDSKSLEPFLETADAVINTTPLGMYPNNDKSPWPEGLPLPAGSFVYDLIYNPETTNLIALAQNMGLRAVNGLGMLVEQAALAFEIWTGVPAPRVIMYSAIKAGV